MKHETETVGQNYYRESVPNSELKWEVNHLRKRKQQQKIKSNNLTEILKFPTITSF